ncbi:MAG: hypothetical protein ACOX5R_13975 [bacterium]|jgi:uncharacterized integral membrane protein
MAEKMALTTKIKIAAVIVIIMLFGIFLGINWSPTPVWIFGWQPVIPLTAIALACFLIGCICGWILAVLYRRRLEES